MTIKLESLGRSSISKKDQPVKKELRGELLFPIALKKNLSKVKSLRRPAGLLITVK